MRSFALILVSVLLAAFGVAGAQAQDADTSRALPDIAPQEVEIRGQLDVAFPSLERQPLVGFNPPPSTYQVPESHVPYMESYKQKAADLPASPLQQPELPAADRASLDRTGFLEAALGRHFDRRGRLHLRVPVGSGRHLFTDLDYAGSEDYDTLLLGAPYTLRGLTSKGDPECMDFERTLENLGLTWEELVDAAILMGTDFNEGIDGIGPKTAVKLLREHGDLWGALDARGESIPNADRIRTLFLDPAVTDEYDYDTDIEPDMDAARRYVTDTWEVPAEEVARGFERIEESVVQTGLDRWR